MLAYSDAVSETTIFDIEISRQIAVLKSNPNAIGAGFGLPGLLVSIPFSLYHIPVLTR